MVFCFPQIQNAKKLGINPLSAGILRIIKILRT